MTAPLYFLSIADAAAAIAARRLSPVELTEAVLHRIAAIDERLNSYVLVTAERALADARKAEAEIAAGNYRGALHGIPIGVKDIYDTGGIRTTCHSHLLANNVPAEDSEAVRRLNTAGTVLLGKLATHEFAFGGPGWDLPFPPARNPWNTEHFTGGSSSGSGAAVAAGLCLAALGSDTAGSIRMPAAYCGLAGIKPTYGRVSRRGVAPLAWSEDHCGPLTWTSRDSALVLQALAGHDPADPASADVPVPDFAAALTGDIRGLRIGVIRHFHETDAVAADGIRTAFDTALEVFRGLGAEVADVTLSPLQDYHAACFVILLTEALAVHEKDLKATPEKFGEIVRDRLTLAAMLSGVDYVQALRMRRRLVAELDAALERFDILITLSAYDAAPQITNVPKFYLFEKPLLTAPFDLTGHPAHAFCIGFNGAGLPYGAQIVGRAFDEATLLKAADAYEQATAWRMRRPPI
ncbi:MAG: amidase [Alphaproteobacteria bacterium]|nr:amidase [Alphaproteobacteria bacterium]